MNGINALIHIREMDEAANRKPVPVIALTANVIMKPRALTPMSKTD